jgi:hypothetical protein
MKSTLSMAALLIASPAASQTYSPDEPPAVLLPHLWFNSDDFARPRQTGIIPGTGINPQPIIPPLGTTSCRPDYH